MTDQSLTATDVRHLSVAGAHGVVDVTVTISTPVRSVLDQLGMPPYTEILTASGRRCPREATIAQLGLEDGALVTAVAPDSVAPAQVRRRARSAAHAAGSRRPATGTGSAPPGRRADGMGPGHQADEPDGETARSSRQGTLLAAGVVATALTALTGVTSLLSGALYPAVSAGVLLVLASLVTAARHPGVPVVGLAAAVSGIGGFLLSGAFASPGTTGWAHVAIIAAAFGGALVVVVAQRAGTLSQRSLTVLLVASAAVAVAAGVALAMGWPLSVLAVAALAVSVPLPLLLPGSLLSLDASDTLDVERLSTTAWSPRRRRRATATKVRTPAVATAVTGAVAQQRLVLSLVLATVTVSSWALVAESPASAGITAALLAMAGTGLGLCARRFRMAADRWLLRSAGMLAFAAASGAITIELAPGAQLALALALLVACASLVILAPLVERGWTSLTLGRLADALEGICIAITPGMAIWASGLVGWIRDLVS